MRRPARLLAVALAAAGLLVVTAGAAHGPGQHGHAAGVEYHSKTVTVPPGGATFTFDCPTGYVLIWLAGWQGQPGIFLDGIEPTESGQGAVVTLSSDASIPIEVELTGSCLKPRTGYAKDRKGKRHAHGLGSPELVEQIVHLDPFTGGELSVACPAGSFPTFGAAERDHVVELQGSYPLLDTRAWRFQLFNTSQTDERDVTLEVLCQGERTRRARKHAHLLRTIAQKILGSVDAPPRAASAAGGTSRHTLEVTCPAGYRAVSGGWSIPQGFFEIVSEVVDEGGYALELEASSQLPAVELTATCLARRTAKAG